MAFFHHIVGLATDAPLILKVFKTMNEIHAFKKAISTRHGGQGSEIRGREGYRKKGQQLGVLKGREMGEIGGNYATMLKI